MQMLSIQEIAQLLDDQGLEPTDLPIAMQGGQWSKAFAFSSCEVDYVVRLGQYLDDYHKDQIASGWSRPLLPIPQIIAIGRHSDHCYAISRRAHGDAFDDQSADGIIASMPSMLRGLDELRTIEPPGGRFGLWDPYGHGTHIDWRSALTSIDHDKPRLPDWKDKLSAHPEASKCFDAGVARLKELAEHVPNHRHVIHGDLLNGNVLTSDHSITAYLDWGCAMTGDSLYDLAMLVFWSPWHPDLRQSTMRNLVLEHCNSVISLRENAEERLQCYELHIGLEALRYQAFAGRWTEVQLSIPQIDEIRTTRSAPPKDSAAH